MMARLHHWLFGCFGHTEHEMDANGVWWIGLRCHRCGKLASKSRSAVNE